MTAEQALILAFQQAAQNLRLQIEQAVRTGALGTAVGRSQQLALVNVKLAALGQRIDPLVLAAVQAPYVAGARAVDAVLPKAGPAFEFAGVHEDAVRAAANAQANRLKAATQLVGRRTDDAFRRVALEEVATGLAEGAGRRDVSARITQRLVREAVTDSTTGFVDRAGRRWQLDTYTRMVARTTTREAASEGTANRLIESGVRPLVTVTNHNTTTKVCQHYEGKTFALPGHEVAGYETLDQLPPFHPNCEHAITPARGNAADFLERLEAGLIAF